MGDVSDAPLVLKNNYWLLRHGRSKPNEAGLIVSTLKNGIKPEHGLSATGREQAKEAGLRWKSELGEAVDPSTLVVVASPFSRTLETATLASEAVGVKGFENVSEEKASGAAASEKDPRFSADEALRERHFGGFELESHDHYKTVWVEDARDVNWRAPAAKEKKEEKKSEGGDGKEEADEDGDGGQEEEGESVVDVAARLRDLFARLEAAHSGKNILLVAHGDTLSIATAVARGGGLGRHREHAQETGELRKL